jgi:hypothetical protein
LHIEISFNHSDDGPQRDLRDAEAIRMATKRLREQGTVLTAGEFERLTEEEWDQLFRLHAALR